MCVSTSRAVALSNVSVEQISARAAALTLSEQQQQKKGFRKIACRSRYAYEYTTQHAHCFSHASMSTLVANPVL